jgi:hypothetical protein
MRRLRFNALLALRAKNVAVGIIEIAGDGLFADDAGFGVRADRLSAAELEFLGLWEILIRLRHA